MWTSIKHFLTDDIHGVVFVISILLYVGLEIWASVSKHERISYRAYLWVIVISLVAVNLGLHKLLVEHNSSNQTEDALEQIASTGRIRIGISHVACGPFLCLDEEKVELTGFDIEVAKQVADAIRDAVKRRGVKKDIKYNFILFAWKPLFEAVQDNDVDFAISAITRDKERANKYDLSFSDPYYKTHPSYAMFENSDGNSMLTGRNAIVIEGTTSFKIAKEIVGNGIVHPADNWFVAFNKFKLSKLEHPIIFDDSAFMRYRLSRMKLMKEVGITELAKREEEYGIAVNYKQQDLLRLINESLVHLKNNGFLHELEEKWLNHAPERCLKEVG